LSVTRPIRLFYLLYISKPQTDRLIYRAIDRSRIASIVELGVGKAQRALRMIEVASRHVPPGQVSYVGVDLFEDRSLGDAAGTGISLKAAYRLLRSRGARARLLPGDPDSALARAANHLAKADLLVVSSGLPVASLARAWYYLPRILHAKSHVFVEKTAGPSGQTTIYRLSLDQVHLLATKAARLRRAA